VKLKCFFPMNELLNQLSELTEEEKKQVQQFLNTKKPSVAFSRATLNVCIRRASFEN
jgi:hypothetical protein